MDAPLSHYSVRGRSHRFVARATVRSPEVIPRFKLSVIEIAFDFCPRISRTLLSQRVLFGKSRPAPPIETTLYWGSQKGSKGARLYRKEEINKYRVELILHAKFLRSYQIRDIFDFQKFCELLQVRHIYYAPFDAES